MSEAAQQPPLLVDATEAARLLGIGRSLFYQLVSSGRFGPQKIVFNSKKMYSVEEISSWIRASCPAKERWIEIRKEQTVPLAEALRDYLTTVGVRL